MAEDQVNILELLDFALTKKIKKYLLIMLRWL